MQHEVAMSVTCGDGEPVIFEAVFPFFLMILLALSRDVAEQTRVPPVRMPSMADLQTPLDKKKLCCAFLSNMAI